MSRILIIDDDSGLRRALRRTLEAVGHEVVEADSSQRGLESYRASQPDLVLTDVYMPEGDGLEGTIRMLSEFPDARVIVMSGGGWARTEAILSDAEKLGAIGTISKPFTIEEVVEAVRRALGGSNE